MDLLHTVGKMCGHLFYLCQFLSDDVSLALINWYCVSCNTGLSTFTSVKQLYTDPSATVLLLTSACCVHSNVYGLGDILCIRYLTAVDSILTPTASSVQIYHHMISCPVEVPFAIIARNPSSIGGVPVSQVRPTLATIMIVSQAEQGIITFTNILQAHKTVVLVCCTIEREPNTSTWGTMQKNRTFPT